MTFLTFYSTDIFHGKAIHFAGLEIVVELFINAIKLVSGAVVVVEGHLRFAVAVDTPAHA